MLAVTVYAETRHASRLSRVIMPAARGFLDCCVPPGGLSREKSQRRPDYSRIWSAALSAAFSFFCESRRSETEKQRKGAAPQICLFLATRECPKSTNQAKTPWPH